ncbi:CRISPR-associated endonuclease Cas2 [Agriterribacter sp.]|mgnify:CR=1 FL=1|uniref:CRISPR-associated endonuclease Cas2 n=1 Tax=Agriterribacter sp. TaxID=2821509 RepID=UPI002C85DCD7|nr:CRISPR-associated endonuclease Cas2 [Agriterribacter sp.]HRP56371.1 CRISPR-associated endonuclease Cas2 [Agriterribacter sp.]
MARPRKKEYTFIEKLRMIKAAGIVTAKTTALLPPTSKPDAGDEKLPVLNERIKQILHIIKDKPMKATETLSMILYDIEDNKVRNLIAKYLLEKGCIRIQKSVYMLRANPKLYTEICRTLKEVQECYENTDSILLVPIPHNTPRSMQIIGKDIQITSLVDKPNVLFF